MKKIFLLMTLVLTITLLASVPKKSNESMEQPKIVHIIVDDGVPPRFCTTILQDKTSKKVIYLVTSADLQQKPINPVLHGSYGNLDSAIISAQKNHDKFIKNIGKIK